MEKKSIGINIFAITLLIYPITSLYKLGAICAIYYKNASMMDCFIDKTFGWLDKLALISKLQLFYVPFFFSILITSTAIGLFKLKKWSYYSLIGISFLFIISIIFPILRNLLYIARYGSSMQFIVQNLSLSLIISLLYFAGILYYFIRPKVKEQFK